MCLWLLQYCSLDLELERAWPNKILAFKVRNDLCTPVMT
jgi:hypothetical protein